MARDGTTFKLGDSEGFGRKTAAPELVVMNDPESAAGPTSSELSKALATDAVRRWRSFESRTYHDAMWPPPMRARMRCLGNWKKYKRRIEGNTEGDPT